MSQAFRRRKLPSSLPRSSLRLFRWLRWGVPGNLKPQRSSSTWTDLQAKPQWPVPYFFDIRTMRKTSLPATGGKRTVSHQYVLRPSHVTWQKEPFSLPPRPGRQAWPCQQPHRMLLLHAFTETGSHVTALGRSPRWLESAQCPTSSSFLYSGQCTGAVSLTFSYDLGFHQASRWGSSEVVSGSYGFTWKTPAVSIS